MSHPRMVVNEREVAERTLIDGAIIPIIITSQADLRLLANAIFSLLLRTKNPQAMHHFMVFINGPDSRTGSTELQDKKQAFLEDLRNTKWHRSDGIVQDMPITVCRIWSRVGHSELIDMAIPWIHTRYYLLQHDDVVILSDDWLQRIINEMQRSDIALVTSSPSLLCPAGTPSSDLPGGRNGNIARLPHLNTAFTAADKIKLAPLRTCWQGYHIPVDNPHMDEMVNIKEWTDWHGSHAGVDLDVGQNKRIAAISHDVGARLYDDMCQAGLRAITLPEGIINHFISASWEKPELINQRFTSNRDIYAKLENEVRARPELWQVYTKHCQPLS